MKLTNWSVFIIALVLATGAAGYTYYCISNIEPPPQKMVPVLVGARDIPASTVITGDMVTVTQIPEEYAHPRALRTPEEAVGKVSKSVLLKDEQVLNSKVAGKDQPGNRFAYKIPDKQRAITLAASELVGVAGFPTVGDRIDILLTKDKDGAKNTSTILQDKEILATGAVAVPQEDGTQRIVPSITLSVTPEEAQVLTLAESTGKMKYTLRSPVDKDAVSLSPLSSK